MLVTLTMKYMTTRVIHDLKGTTGPTVPSLVVKINPSTAITRNWEKVTRFPMPGSWHLAIQALINWKVSKLKYLAHKKLKEYDI